MKLSYKILDDEYIWCGSTSFGAKNPFNKESEFHQDMFVSSSNQTMPLVLSNKGHYYWCENPIIIDIKDGVLTIEGDGVKEYKVGKTLKDAYRHAMKNHFAFDGRKLPDMFFKTAQYNTWMHFNYFPTQEKVLEYAHNIIKHGFIPGIFILDEGWHGRYGEWEFDFARFPNPKQMVEQLHSLGFKVMLWVTPYVCPDGYNFAYHSRPQEFYHHENADKLFIRNKSGEVVLFKWWNGFSAQLDMTKDWDREYLQTRLDYLQATYNVDGFKFDAGAPHFYSKEWSVNGDFPDDYDRFKLSNAWFEFGAKYEFHEWMGVYRAGGKNTIQRLSDKSPKWEPNGINALIPSSILQALMGTPFTCPDMIGGGAWAYSANPDFMIEQELFVRTAQVSAFMPMMQFSWAPWEILDDAHLQMVKKANALHNKFSDYTLKLIHESYTSGEPIIKCLDYVDPDGKFGGVIDEFMVGEDLLVAPIVKKDVYSRIVKFPKGRWQDEDGKIYLGNTEQLFDCPIDKVLYFTRVS